MDKIILMERLRIDSKARKDKLDAGLDPAEDKTIYKSAE